MTSIRNKRNIQVDEKLFQLPISLCLIGRTSIKVHTVYFAQHLKFSRSGVTIKLGANRILDLRNTGAVLA